MLSAQNQERFTRLWTDAQPAVSGYVYSLVRDAAAAKDLVQETALVLLRRFAEYDAGRPFVPWALGVARYQVLGFRRDGVRSLVTFDTDLVEQFTTLWSELAPRGGAVRAEVVSTADARLAGHPAPLRPGEQIALRALRLQSGSMRLRLANGVVLDIAGPMEGRFESAMRLRVTGGKVTAEVGAEGKGFTIETAEARVVDLGTRFGVDVSPGGGTDVVVFEGQVEIYEPRASRQAVDPGLIARLDAGEAVRVNRAQEPSRIVFVVQQPDEGDWTTRAEPPRGAVITHVADNRALADTRRFYRVSTGGMTAGAPARHMQRARWFPYRGDDLPDWLEGADLVETFGLDKWKEDFALTVTLGRPALLCVFQDSRVPPPEWLRDGFTDSGFRLQIRRLPGDERQPGVEPVADVPFSVWTREVHRAGTVALGPPRGTEAGGRGRMYGVAARPLPAASPVLPPPRP